jgi:TolB protein
MLKMIFLKNKMNLMNSVLRMTAVAFAVALLPVASHATIDTIAVDVGISVFKTMPIGVVPFAEPKGAIEWIEEKPHQIVTRDANLSGRFDVVASDKFNLPLFSKAHAKHYVTGKVTPVGGKLKLECYLYVAQTKDLLLGETYTVEQKDLRRAMHLFFDEVIYRLWGERGVASTKLAYVSKIDGIKQVVVSDYDGFHRSQITRDTTISMMPVWMKDNAGLYYVNFKTHRPKLYSKVFGGSEKSVFPQLDQTYSPAVNPKTGELLFSSTVDGKTDLYIGNPATGKAKKFA